MQVVAVRLVKICISRPLPNWDFFGGLDPQTEWVTTLRLLLVRFDVHIDFDFFGVPAGWLHVGTVFAVADRIANVAHVYSKYSYVYGIK